MFVLHRTMTTKLAMFDNPVTSRKNFVLMWEQQPGNYIVLVLVRTLARCTPLHTTLVLIRYYAFLPLFRQNRPIFAGNSGLFWIYVYGSMGNA